MTAGELITLLAVHNPDLPVYIAIPRRVRAVDVAGVERVVQGDGTYLELYI